MKFVVAADSLKGSLTSAQANSIIAQAIQKHMPSSEVRCFDTSDGGEGFLTALRNSPGFSRVDLLGVDAIGQPHHHSYLWNAASLQAVCESAQTLGLTHMQQQGNLNSKLPLRAHSQGVGSDIAHAIQRGATTVYVGLGGTCSTDGGLGLLLELGAKAWDTNGTPIVQRPGTNPLLAPLGRIELPQLPCSLVGLADVRSPLLGPSGAAQMFAPQKGADPETVLLLESHMTLFAQALARAGAPIAQIPGAGAAGGLGAAILALGGRIMSGVDYLASSNGFLAAAAHANVVFLAEGTFDDQSLHGKAPARLAQLAHWVDAQHTVVLAGRNSLHQGTPLPAYLDQVIAIHPPDLPLPLALDPHTTRAALKNAVHKVLQDLGFSPEIT